MSPKGIVGVVLVSIVIIAAIVISNWFFETILGVNISKLPAFLKAIINLMGLAVVFFGIKKFFNK